MKNLNKKYQILCAFVILLVVALACGGGDTGDDTSSQDDLTEVSQWGDSATASSEYSNPSWAALQAAGPPDTEGCGDIETSWASASSTGEDWLEVEYALSVIPVQIDIYETYHPGSITEVEVRDEDGDYHTVWTGTPSEEQDCPRIFSIDVDDVDVAIDAVRIHLDQSIIGSWNEIDAVQLVGLR